MTNVIGILKNQKEKGVLKIRVTCNLKKCPTSNIPTSRCKCDCQGINHGKITLQRH